MFVISRKKNGQVSYLTNAELWSVDKNFAVRLSKSDAEAIAKDYEDSEKDRHKNFRHTFRVEPG